jgi:hypothetical protein
VEAAPRALGERLRHERRGHAALLGEHVDQVAQGRHAVGGDEGVRVVEVLLELARRVLVVVRVVAPAEGVHRVAHGREVVEHAGDAAGVVAGLGAVVALVGGGDPALLVLVEQEVLDLRADLADEAVLGEAGDRLLQDDPRRVRPRLAVHVRVAVHDREALPDERDRGVGVEVGDRDQVGVLRALPDEAGGEAREPELPVLQLVGGGRRDELGAGLPVQVHEQGEDEPDAVGLRPLAEGGAGEARRVGLAFEDHGAIGHGGHVSSGPSRNRLFTVRKRCFTTVSNARFREGRPVLRRR